MTFIFSGQHLAGLLPDLDLPLGHGVVLVDQEQPGVGGFGIEAVGEDDVEELVAFSPVLVAARGVCFADGMGMVVDHLAIVGIDIFENLK